MGRYSVFLAKDSAAYDRSGFIRYLKDQERSENTIAAYVTAADQFFGSGQDREFDQGAVLEFKQKLMDEVSPKTVNLKMCALECYGKYSGVAIDVRRVRIQQVSFLENVITTEEYQRLTEQLQADGKVRDYFVVKYLACTGARVSELVRFTKKHLDMGFAELWTKGKVRTIYIPDALIRESMEFFDSQTGEHLFYNRYGDKLTDESVRQMLVRAAKRYGIRRSVMHPHAFRHFFAINFLEQNHDLALLADIMGHSGVNTTMIYLRKSKHQQWAAISRTVTW